MTMGMAPIKVHYYYYFIDVCVFCFVSTAPLIPQLKAPPTRTTADGAMWGAWPECCATRRTASVSAMPLRGGTTALWTRPQVRFGRRVNIKKYIFFFFKEKSIAILYCFIVVFLILIISISVITIIIIQS